MSNYHYEEESPRRHSVSKRKSQAMARLENMKLRGETPQPVVAKGRGMATSFWGRAFCRYLAAYADYDHRLQPGRSYLTHGCVLDLHLVEGVVSAQVSGSEIYQVEIVVEPLKATVREALVEALGGSINSLVSLFKGEMDDETARLITSSEQGLFPDVDEIRMSCTCLDSAELCKHAAAVLYGLAVRFDEDAMFLFTWRGVDPKVFASQMSHRLKAASTTKDDEIMQQCELEALFGIEIDDGSHEKA